MMRKMLRAPLASAGFVIVILTLAGVLGVLPGPKVAFASGNWTFTGSMHTARSNFTLTQFKNGKVLAAGGVDGSGNYLSSAELYNPTTGIWSLTG
ncbi:MAG: kelch motif-containing protein, partial [Chloroflexota bacterium]|nr:kelch motif-containing protein [Chloroflexota bacterium]